MLPQPLLQAATRPFRSTADEISRPIRSILGFPQAVRPLQPIQFDNRRPSPVRREDRLRPASQMRTPPAGTEIVQTASTPASGGPMAAAGRQKGDF